MRRALGAGAVALALALLPGCGSTGSTSAGSPSASPKETDRGEGGKAADTSTCLASAKPVTGTLPSGYPHDFPLPPGAVLFHVEDRGADGVIGTAIVKATLKEVLAQLNGPAQKAGYKVTSGETETHDAEANWTGHGYRGRWAIRDSSTCPGEVVLQLLSKKG